MLNARRTYFRLDGQGFLRPAALLAIGGQQCDEVARGLGVQLGTPLQLNSLRKNHAHP